MSETKYSFAKQERLCSKIAIDRLFAQGESFIAYPLRIVLVYEPESTAELQQASILISVSKRKFKRAVKRNRVKRLIRETYRLRKAQLNEILHTRGYKADVALLYLKDELPTFAEIDKAMSKALNTIAERIKG